MQLNQATDYGFRVVLYLSCRPPGSIISGQVIAQEQRIPVRFLQKIMRQLTLAGLTRSYRGIEGGFALLKAPQEISLLDVVTAMEGPVSIHRCLEDTAECSRQCANHCSVHRALDRVQQTLLDGLTAVTFDRLAAEEMAKKEENKDE